MKNAIAGLLVASALFASQPLSHAADPANPSKTGSTIYSVMSGDTMIGTVRTAKTVTIESEADEVTHDEKTGVATFTGHARISVMSGGEITATFTAAKLSLVPQK